MSQKKDPAVVVEKEVQEELKILAMEVKKLGDDDSDALDDKLDKLEDKIGKMKDAGVPGEKVEKYKDALDKIK